MGIVRWSLFTQLCFPDLNSNHRATEHHGIEAPALDSQARLGLSLGAIGQQLWKSMIKASIEPTLKLASPSPSHLRTTGDNEVSVWVHPLQQMYHSAAGLLRVWEAVCMQGQGVSGSFLPSI